MASWVGGRGRNPGQRWRHHRDAEDEETGYEYDWTPYDERLRHVEAHLLAFEQMIDLSNIDLLIGQQAQNTLEHAMKALLEVHGARYQRTHNIGDLLGRVRDVDPDLRRFQFSIPPDIYTQYAGEQVYRLTHRQPLLTDHPDYRGLTVADAQRIIHRAREVRQSRTD